MKKITVLLLAVVMLLGSGTSALAADPENASGNPTVFRDVDDSSETGIAVYTMVKEGIISGFGDGTFRPLDGLTRAQACKIINLEFGFTEADPEGFKDVNGSEWFAKDSRIAKKAGYIQGYSDGTFRQGNRISRQEVCVILVRIFQALDVEMTMLPLTVEVTDRIADWAKDDVMLILSNGFMTTGEDGAFRAADPINRGDFCVLLSKFLGIANPAGEEANETIGTGGSDSSGGSSGGSSGEQSPEDAAVTSIARVYAAMLDPAFIRTVEDLQSGANDISEQIVNLIRQCFASVLADDAAGATITPEYVATTYAADIASVRSLWSSLAQPEKDLLISTLGYLPDISILREYFTI